ncbi:MAG: hypothetical protein WAJ85_10060 [Candidatus Baltobacteraceae bacterium]
MPGNIVCRASERYSDACGLRAVRAGERTSPPGPFDTRLHVDVLTITHTPSS